MIKTGYRLSLMTLMVCTLCAFVSAQTPLVPGEFEFGGIKIRLTKAAQKEVQETVNALTQSKSHFQAKVDRADLYLGIVERVLEEENVPDDIKYLAIQESAYISDAVSKSNAVGFWQFKKEAAEEVGLRVDNQIDERKNIVSATRGAAKYLKTNHYYFNNWVYAVVAYYTGRGGAKKYVDPKYFGADKMIIDKGDHWYFKKFLAHKFAYQDAIGKNENPDIILTEYTRGAKMNLKTIAKETSTDLNLLQEYNKWLLRGSVPTDKTYSVIIPITNGKRKEYLALKASKGNEEFAAPNSYPQITGDIAIPSVTIVKVNGIDALIAGTKDNVASMAERGKITEDQLINFNDLDYRDEVQAGHVYYLSRKKNRSKVYYHTLGPDETLWDISQKYGIKLIKLLKKNRLSLADELKPGRVLWLRKKRPRNEPVQYKEVPKDSVETPEGTKTEVQDFIVAETPKPELTIGGLDTMVAVTAQDSAVLTSVESQDSVGTDSLDVNVALDTMNTEENEEWPELVEQEDALNDVPAGEEVYVVAKGDTFYSISKRFNISVEVLAQVNTLMLDSPLSIGQKLIIPETKGHKENTKAGADEIITHRVKAGETLYQIANNYGVTVKQIMEWNDKPDFTVQIDEDLIINISAGTNN